MYSDKNNREAHLVDFKNVLTRIEKETKTSERDYRIRILKENIAKCSD